MEQTYTIAWCEKKTTTTGKEKLDATLTGSDGKTVEKVTIWADFPGFAEIMNGGQVTGTLSPAKDPRFGPTLYPPRPTTAPRGGGFKQKLMDDAMAKKNESISHFQGNKELSIKVSSTFRAAYETALVDYQEQRRLTSTGATLEVLFEKWREFYWMHFDCDGTQYPPIQ